MSILSMTAKKIRQAISDKPASAAGMFVPAGQSIYDPMVFGVYDLATQTAVPRPADRTTLPTNLDIATKRAQRYRRVTQRPLDISRYHAALKALEPGSGICLDACTSNPVEHVKVEVERKGYIYRPIDLTPGDPAVQREDLQSLTISDASVAQIISCDTLEHVADFRRALTEMYRVLVDDGQAIIHMPVYYFDRPAGEDIRPGVDPWDHTRYFSAREVIDASAAVGFTVLRATFCLDYGAIVLVLGKNAKANELG